MDKVITMRCPKCKSTFYVKRDYILGKGDSIYLKDILYCRSCYTKLTCAWRYQHGEKNIIGVVADIIFRKYPNITMDEARSLVVAEVL